MLKTNRAIEKFLSKTNVTLEIVKDDAFVKEKISTFGYTDQRIAEGIALRSEVESIYQTVLSTRNEQLKSSKVVQEKFAAASKKLSLYLDIFKTAFYDTPELNKELGLDTKLKRAFSSFVTQAVNFYTNVLTKGHILEKVAKFDLTKEKMQQELAEINELQVIYVKYRNIYGENQRLTQERNRKLGELTRYMHELRTIMTMIFEKENIHVLERVGIFIRNRRRTKKSEPEPAPTPTPAPTAPAPGASPGSAPLPEVK